MQNAVLADYNDLVLAGGAIYDGFTDFLREDVGGKWEAVHPRVMDTLDEVMQYNIRTKKAIAADLPDILAKLKEHFEHNDFFVKDIWNFFASAAYVNIKTYLLRAVVLLASPSTAWRCWTRRTYSAVKSFASMLVDIVYIDIAATLDVIPVIKALGKNAMVHWNATMTDLAELRNATHRWTREVLKSAHDSLAQLESSVAAQLDRWDAFVEDAKRRIERAVVPGLLTAQEMFAFLNYHPFRPSTRAPCRAFVESVKTHLMSMEEVREVLHLYSQYASWLEDFHVQDYFDQYLSELSDTAEWVVRDLRQTHSDCKAYFDALCDAAFGHYEALHKLPPPVAYVRKLAGKVYQKALWAWRYYDVTKEIGESLLWALHQLEVGLMDLLNHMDASAVARPTLEPSSSLILDKDLGLLEYTQTLPIPGTASTACPSSTSCPRTAWPRSRPPTSVLSTSTATTSWTPSTSTARG
ncbi:uncharacterized protein LOC117648382 [Thrips palmi]|uniref:Uncharacterized protein LOC117648382 n=1 Tax=Thrips palmi TaxID=161013 RepID=A0A6P8ZCU6_THRPL|nr:uncharacterized protein LOC117648382 [Thrips palmi]